MGMVILNGYTFSMISCSMNLMVNNDKFITNNENNNKFITNRMLTINSVCCKFNGQQCPMRTTNGFTFKTCNERSICS